MRSPAEADEVCHDGRWIFTEEALARARSAVHERAVQALRNYCGAADHLAITGAARGDSVADGLGGIAVCTMPQPLSPEETDRVVLIYARMLPELCSLSGAPSEVRWTAMVLYRRFYAVRSPMEFEAAMVMFACVHVACKIEEFHEITLDKLLNAANFSRESTMKTKVLNLEVPILEAVGFALVVEPKPEGALAFLHVELKRRILAASQREDINASTIIQEAQSLVLEFAVQTDAILRWPTSVIIAAALCEAIDAKVPPETPENELLVEELGSILGHVEGASNRSALQRQVVCVQTHMRKFLATLAETERTHSLNDADVWSAARGARKCSRIFERIRERQEAHRLDRKRHWSVMRTSGAFGRRQVPTPIMQGLAEINRQAAALHVGGLGFVPAHEWS